MATGTLSGPNEANPSLGDTVHFTWTAEGLHGKEKALIESRAYQDTDGGGVQDDLVFVWLDAADAGLLLGGGASDWTINGGPAHCVERLGYFDSHDMFQVLATLEFDAAG